jgi:hypothetical protein
MSDADVYGASAQRVNVDRLIQILLGDQHVAARPNADAERSAAETN